MNEKIFSVSELNNIVKMVLESVPGLQHVCVRGEVSNFKNHYSGHFYFSLKDANGAIKAVMFNGSSRINLSQVPIQDGAMVVCRGKISVFPRDGQYQLYVTDMQLDGQGDLFLAYEQLKNKLEAEGLFASEHKKPLPAFPERVGVITSGTGAAVRDVIRVLGKRWPAAKVIVLPVCVQGPTAPPEIAGAIRYANQYQVADVLIVGRGGGSMEDLWCFNDERVARAIYDSEIPVISAVGHEPDFTIADFVADKRAATPSNGAELAVTDQTEVLDALYNRNARLYHAIKKHCDSLKTKLSGLASRNVMQNPASIYQIRHMDLDRLTDRLLSAQKELIHKKKNLYVEYAASLEALSPLKVLTRGYSVAMDSQGKTITDSAFVNVGDSLRLRLQRGTLQCRVEDKEN